ERPIDLAGPEIVLVEVEGAGLAPESYQALIVSCFRHQIDRTPQAVGAEPRSNDDPRHEVEHILQIRAPRLLDFFGADDLCTARHALDLLTGLLIAAEAVRYRCWWERCFPHDHRRQRYRSLRGLGSGQAQQHDHHTPQY